MNLMQLYVMKVLISKIIFFTGMMINRIIKTRFSDICSLLNRRIIKRHLSKFSINMILFWILCALWILFFHVLAIFSNNKFNRKMWLTDSVHASRWLENVAGLCKITVSIGDHAWGAGLTIQDPWVWEAQFAG